MDIEFYRKHGWVLIPIIIPQDYLAIAKERGLALVKWAHTKLGTPALAGPFVHLKHVGCAGAYDSELMKLYTSEFSYNLAKELLDTDTIFLFNDQMVYKLPHDNLAFDAHCDNCCNGNTSGEVATVNIGWVLDDFTDENGTLSLKSMSTDEWTIVYPKAGDIIAINGNCLHFSGPNNTDEPRGLYACVYSEKQLNFENYYKEPFLKNW